MLRPKNPIWNLSHLLRDRKQVLRTQLVNQIWRSNFLYAKEKIGSFLLINIYYRFGKYTGACFYSYQALAILLTQIRELSVAAQVTEK